MSSWLYSFAFLGSAPAFFLFKKLKRRFCSQGRSLPVLWSWESFLFLYTEELHKIGFRTNLRVFTHSLCAKNPPNRPRLLGPVKLTSAFPPNYFLCRPASREWRLEVDRISRNTRHHFGLLGSTARLPQ